MESCGDQDKSSMILYLTGNDCFLATVPIGDPTKSEKGGWVNGPALHPGAASLARYSVKTSGWSKADFQLSKMILTLSPSKAMFMLHSMPLSSLLHHTWSGWLASYLWKLLRCSGDCTTRTTSGSRVLLLTAVTDMCAFAVGECAFVLLIVVTALSSIMEPSICLYGQDGLERTWIICLPHSYTLPCCLSHLQWGSLGKGTTVCQMVEATTSEAFMGWGLDYCSIWDGGHQCLVHGSEGQPWWAHIAQNLMSYIWTVDQLNSLSCCMINFL